MTRLVELHPEWVSHGVREKVGFTFECPLHRSSCRRLAVLFANPIDGGPSIDEDGQERREMALGWHLVCRWERTGTTFEEMTLSPSLHFQVGQETHWHGFVRDGQVT